MPPWCVGWCSGLPTTAAHSKQRERAGGRAGREPGEGRPGRPEWHTDKGGLWGGNYLANREGIRKVNQQDFLVTGN